MAGAWPSTRKAPIWAPNVGWVRYLREAGWRTRRITKKRRQDPAADSAIMKRWATIQRICSADMKEAQPRIACIFKGKGKISEAERLSSADDADTHWTPSGWIDRESWHQWIRKTWKAHADVRLARRMGAALIIADNHTSQARASTRRPSREYGAELMCRLSFMSKKFA